MFFETVDGRVYSWGRAKDGRLGHGDKKILDETLPRVIESLSRVRVVKIACGWSHCVVATGELEHSKSF